MRARRAPILLRAPAHQALALVIPPLAFLSIQAALTALVLPSLLPADRASFMRLSGLVLVVSLPGVLAACLETIRRTSPLYRLTHRERESSPDEPTPPSRAALRDSRVAPRRSMALITGLYVAGGGLGAVGIFGVSRAAFIAFAFLSGLGLLGFPAGLTLWRQTVAAWLAPYPPEEVAAAVDRSSRRDFAVLAACLVGGAGLVGLAAAWGPRVVEVGMVSPLLAVLAVLAIAALCARLAASTGARLDRDRAALCAALDQRHATPGATAPQDETATPRFETREARELLAAVDRIGSGVAKSASAEDVALRSVEDLRRSKTLFMASMSHDLRSPLNSILGFSELLLSGSGGPLREAQRESVQVIQRSGTDLLALLNDILDSARFEAGRLELRQEWTPSVEILTEAVRCGQELLAVMDSDPHWLEIEAELQPGLPPVYVDRERIVQAVVGLFRHASRAMTGGTIRLFARVTPARDGAGQVLRVDVTDRGGGIRPEDRERMFEAFHAVTSISGRRIGGLGLSLHLARSLVRAHGGDVWFDASSPEGTTFTVALPTEGPKPKETRARRA